MGVPVAGRARVGAQGGNRHALLSQLLSFAGALLWLLLSYSGLSSKDCFYYGLLSSNFSIENALAIAAMISTQDSSPAPLSRRSQAKLPRSIPYPSSS